MFHVIDEFSCNLFFSITDVDPKSVVCLFYKQGTCHKGEKCKFSHDLSKEQKTAKKNLYVDSRDLSKEGSEYYIFACRFTI